MPIPPLSLQPLVENAVLHGVSRMRDGGTVRISARRDGGDVLIEIENPLPPDAPPAASGSRTAVRNIAQRLALVYGDAARIDLGREGDIFRASVRVPLKHRPAPET